ncbi:MAG: hypothetical protein ACSHW0_04865 [Thalassotalea sp.]
MIFDHINIDVPKALLAPTKAFYENIFDLTEGFRPQLSRTGYWMYFADKPVLHLFERSEALLGERKSYLDHVAFRLSDINDFKARLAKYDIEYRTLVNNEIHITQLFLHDPAGAKLECIFQH